MFSQMSGNFLVSQILKYMSVNQSLKANNQLFEAIVESLISLFISLLGVQAPGYKGIHPAYQRSQSDSSGNQKKRFEIGQDEAKRSYPL